MSLCLWISGGRLKPAPQECSAQPDLQVFPGGLAGKKEPSPCPLPVYRERGEEGIFSQHLSALDDRVSGDLVVLAIGDADEVCLGQLSEHGLDAGGLEIFFLG